MSNYVSVRFKLKTKNVEKFAEELREIDTKLLDVLGKKLKNCKVIKRETYTGDWNPVVEKNNCEFSVGADLWWAQDRKKLIKDFISVSVSASDACFRAYEGKPQQEAQQNTECFIQIAKVIYHTLHPEFGFGDIDYVMEPYLWDFQNCLVWLNFFSPQMVKEIGKDRFLTIKNVTKIQELNDGGIFVQMALTPIGEPAFELKEETKKHLGYPKPDYEEKIKELKSEGQSERVIEQYIVTLKKIWEDEK